MKLLSKITKKLGLIVLILLVLVGLLYTAIRSHTFQNKVVQVAIAELAKGMDTKITVGSIEIGWWKKITLNNVLIYDQQGDTLIQAGKVYAKYKNFNKENRTIGFSLIELHDANVHFEKQEDKERFNFNFFVEYFQPKKKRDPNDPKIIWTITSNKVLLKNSAFRYRNYALPKPKDRRFNENYFEFAAINSKIDSFSVVGDSLRFLIKSLNTKEKSGLFVKNIIADTRIHSQGIAFLNMQLITPNSTLGNQLIMKYNGYPELSDFVKKVELNADLKNSKVSLKDIAYFYEPLWRSDKVFTISGKSEGPISRLDVNQAFVSYGKFTRLAGNIDFTGLPNIQNTLIDCNIKSFKTDINEISALLNVPNNNAEISTLGKIGFKGNWVGFTHDFVSRGNWSTNLGKVYTDVKFKYTNKKSIMDASYVGLINTQGFNLKPILPSSQLGAFAGDIEIDGSGLNLSSMQSNIKSNITYLEFADKKVENGTVNGSFIKGVFDGIANVQDKNLDLVFDGQIDLNNDKPILDMDAQINKANLAYFGLDTGQSIISGNIQSDLKGSTIDNLVGTLNIQKLKLLKNGAIYEISQANLIAEKEPNYRNIQLTSDIADISLKGDYSIEKLPISINNFLWNLSPDFFKYKTLKDPEIFNFDIDIKKPEVILSYLPQSIRFEQIESKGYFNSLENTLNTQLNSSKIYINGLTLNSVNLRLDKKKDEALYANLNTLQTSYDSISISDKLSLTSQLENNKMDFALKSNSNDLKFDARINGNIAFSKDTIALHFLSSGFSAHGRNWELNESGIIEYHSQFIEVKNLVVQSGAQELKLNGKISNKPTEKLRVNFTELEPGKLLYDLNLLTKDTLQGVAQGWVDLSNLYGNPLLESDFTFNNIKWNNDTLGSITVKAENDGKEILKLDDTEITAGPLKGIKLEGSIDLNRKHENFNLGITLPKSNIGLASYFLEGILSDVDGFAEGKNLQLRGKFDKPSLTGKVLLSDIGFNVDYLNTAYLLRSSQVIFDKNILRIVPSQIYDINNHSGLVSGTISHQYFDQWKFDMHINNINNMQVLNTNQTHNSLFYGQGYGSGSASFTGPLEGIDIKLKLKTEKGTKFSLPLEDEEAQTSLSYVRFKKEETLENRKAKKAFSNINSIIVDLEATPDAVAEMIFDSKAGDVMTGSGSGQLKFELNKSADFFMYGKYTIEQGKYLFTAFNFVNKPFDIEKGGTVFWDGDPYNAKIDLAAVYKQKTSLSPLLNPSEYNTTDEYERAVDRLKSPVDVHSKIKLSGLLFTPKIEFDITFPNLNSVGGSSIEVTRLKNKFLSDPQELNKQFLSLLVINRFLPVNFQDAGQAAFSAPGQSASEMLSAQLNNWVSDLGIGLIDNISFDLGKDTADKREIVISVEKSIKRLTIKGAYGNNAGSDATNIGLEYRITKDGNLKLRTNYTPFYYANNYTNNNQQGLGGVRRGTVGIFFRREFETIRKKK